jgi:hypothetical protein
MNSFSNRDFVRCPDRDGPNQQGSDGLGHDKPGPKEQGEAGTGDATTAEQELEMHDGYGRPATPETLEALSDRQPDFASYRSLDPNRAGRPRRTHCEVIYWPFPPRPETR